MQISIQLNKVKKKRELFFFLKQVLGEFKKKSDMVLCCVTIAKAFVVENLFSQDIC